MKQFSHIVADSICDYHIVGGSLTHPAHMGVFFMGSELQTMNGQNKLALWAERVSACRSSDLSVRDWCKENDISEPTYYRWQKKLYGIAKAQQEQPRFAEITPTQITSSPAAVTVRFAGAEIDIQNGADEEIVGMVLRLLKSC